jgi:hypothetical protein
VEIAPLADDERLSRFFGFKEKNFFRLQYDHFAVLVNAKPGDLGGYRIIEKSQTLVLEKRSEN